MAVSAIAVDRKMGIQPKDIPMTRGVLADPKEKRSLAQRTVDWCMSWPRMMGFCQPKGTISKVYTRGDWKEDSDGLIVMVHGLGEGGASEWNAHVSILEKYPTIDIFTPQVVKDGRCALNESAEPILTKVSDYAKKHPNKPVCLIGLSNGSRIVTWIETKLRNEHPKTSVRVSTIAGIHLGTWGINLLAYLRVPQILQRIGWQKKFPQVLCEELSVGSARSKALLESVRAPLPKDCAPRSYELIAAAHDWMIINTESSLPDLNRGEVKFIVWGHGHLSIPVAVAREQIDRALNWMKKLMNQSDEKKGD
jgi:hypothetical protein